LSFPQLSNQSKGPTVARIINLDEPRAVEQVRRIDNLERQSPLGNSSVTRGALRVASTEGLIVEGSQKVSGWLIVTGTLKVVGTFLLDGITTVTGAFTSKGLTRFEGDTTQSGPFHVQGATDLTGNMTVKTGGKILVEGPSAATLQNGELSFATGGKVVAYPSGVAAVAGTAQVVASVAGAYLFFGSNNLAVSSAGASASGGLTVSGDLVSKLPLKAGAAVNIHVDGNGKFWRTS
jgi:cytoskeletal protein CcmA (bactofilin family)